VAWGAGHCGQSGDPHYGQSCVPAPNGGFEAIAAGEFHSLAIKLHPHGDLNCDGVVDFGDINPFVLALSNPPAYVAAFPQCDITLGDMNCDGFVSFQDINPFVACLSSGGCDCP
jgi:hypothetical protein